MVWRTHDAQYWGVPQRRRRISVVADFGGDTASKIQFDRESVSGDIAESREAGEGFAEAAEAGASYAVRIRGGCDGGGKGALVQTEKSGTLGCGNDQTIFCMATQQGGAELRTDDRAPTLTAAAGMSGNNQPVVAIPINDKATRWQGGGESRNHDGSGNGLGIGKEGDPSPTLTAGDRHGVMAVALDMTYACDVIRECGEQVPALQARMGTGGNQVPLTYGIGNGQACEASIMAEELAQTLNTMHDAQAVMCSAVDCRNFTEGGEVNGTLQAKESGGQSLNLNNTVRQNMVVRRLTPMECERLQGFPDGWTDIGDWVKTDKRGRKIKVKGSADSPRYKALGNSIALPFWEWMLRRMARYLPEGATLGSLFDGIGGFPLIWERIHGKGTARWASEIEPFPIVVTKKHFPEEE